MENNFKKNLIIGIASTFFVFILIYGIFRSKEVIFGVNIKDLNIQNYQSFTENPVKITGNSKNALFLSINDREINIDKEGNFQEDIALLPGYNILEIKAKDKFGNQDFINYKLLLN